MEKQGISDASGRWPDAMPCSLERPGMGLTSARPVPERKRVKPAVAFLRLTDGQSGEEPRPGLLPAWMRESAVNDRPV